MDRSKITFAQAEGFKPLPKQLMLKQVDKKTKTLIWACIYRSLDDSIESSAYSLWFVNPWKRILQDYWAEEKEENILTWPSKPSDWRNILSDLFNSNHYEIVFETLQFILRHPYCPKDVLLEIKIALEKGNSAYRLDLSNDVPTIMPMGSEAEIIAIEKAFQELNSHGPNNATTHLRQAAEFLNTNKYDKAISESIHAVECTCRKLVNNDAATLTQALKKLKKEGIYIHKALEDGLEKIYGYASDENGVRHASAFDKNSNVDEADALFMFGACASFVSYLLKKGKDKDLI